MIAITVRWDVKPEYDAQFLDLTREFTDACRTEPGCLWFDWSKSCEREHEYVLIEAYRDADAGKAHVESAHFRKAMGELGLFLASRPQVVSVETDADGWSDLGEIEMPA